MKDFCVAFIGSIFFCCFMGYFCLLSLFVYAAHAERALADQKQKRIFLWKIAQTEYDICENVEKALHIIKGAKTCQNVKKRKNRTQYNGRAEFNSKQSNRLQSHAIV